MAFDLRTAPPGHCRDCWHKDAQINEYGRCRGCQKEHDAYLAEEMQAEYGSPRRGGDNFGRAHPESTYNPVKGKA